MRKVLIIEDDLSIRKLLTYDLKQINYEVISVEHGMEALKLVEEFQFDVIIIDWMLPELDGIDLVKKFRKMNLDSLLIMLSAKSSESDILEAFEAGVDDYISKPFSPRILTARIEAHLNRIDALPQETFVLENMTIHKSKHQVLVNEQEVKVTKKEFDLLVYLVDNLDIVLTRDQILNKLWNFEYDGDTRIVDVHVFKLRKKIEAADLKIDSVRGVGYIAKL